MIEAELIDTRYGKMWVFPNDPGCSRLLKEYGEFSELEVETIRRYIPPNALALDIGAHIGALTLPMAKVAKTVIAFEPQDAARELLKRNIDLAGLTNVEVRSEALGFDVGKAYYSLSHSTWKNSYGSVGMEPKPFEGAEECEMVRLDDLGLRPDFVKIDAEGMEIHILAGGMHTLRALRPTILLERPDNPELEAQQIKVLSLLGYYIARLDFPMFVANNWRANPLDLYRGKAHMMQIALRGTD